MFAPSSSNTKTDPVIGPFIDLWLNSMNEANDTTRQTLEEFAVSADAKTWQRRWLDAVSRSMDAYMRSPAFLQSMKQNTELLVKTKRQMDDYVAEFARNANIPTATDISGLFERLHSIEDVILQRLTRIEERLETIEQQIGADQLVGQ
jgi:hypothetical protein